MTRRVAARAALLLAFAGGCAAQQVEALAQEPPAPADSTAPRSLAELELERAANNTRLRELGVELPLDQQAGEGEAVTETTGTGGNFGKSKQADGADRPAGTSVAPAPGGVPMPKPSKLDHDSDDARAEKQPRRDKGGGAKPKDESKKLEADDVRPDEAKATQPVPNNQLDPQARCQQVCDLAAISCGLGDEICELADRHPNDGEYTSACERANADCEVAKEACDACAE
jgi:hypothetical protein